MIRQFKDSYKVSLVLAVAFFFGMLATFYSFYATADRLANGEGSSAWNTVYWVSGLSFAIGAAAIYLSLVFKREIIVYREKDLDERGNDSSEGEQSANAISLDSVRNSIQASATPDDTLQTGLNAICKELSAGQGAAYLTRTDNGIRKVELKSGYALSMGESTVITYEYGEGLVGQAAAEGRSLYIDDVPEGYIKIISGLGTASPKYLLITPIKAKDKVSGILEIASFTPFSAEQRKFVEDAATEISNKLTKTE